MKSTAEESFHVAFMILETKKAEGEDYTFFFHKSSNSPDCFNDIKGILFASTGICNNIFGEDVRMLSFSNTKTDYWYKGSTYSFSSNLIAAIVTNASTPDNVVFYLLHEFVTFVDFFFENVTEVKNNAVIMNKICDNLAYQASQFALNEPQISLTTLNNSPLSSLVFSFNEKETAFTVKPPISTVLKSEIIELINTLNSDRSLIQEAMTSVDMPIFPRGCCLLFRGFTVFSSLSNFELSNLAKIANLNGLYERQNDSQEIIICEEIYVDEKKNNPLYYVGIKEKKRVIATIVAIREFTLIIYLDYLGRENSHFDPFYTKRAEDLMLSVLKKNFNYLLNGEIYVNSVKLMNEVDNADRIVKEFSTEKDLPSTTEVRTKVARQKFLSGLVGVLGEMKHSLNLLHYAVCENKENLIYTHDICVSAEKYELFAKIYKNYARMQSNMNKLLIRRKQLFKRIIFSYDDVYQSREQKLKKEIGVRTIENKEKYVQLLKPVKIEEMGVKSIINGVELWSCAKLYEITNLTEGEIEDFMNFKIVFLTYEARVPINVDEICEELLLSDMFI